MPVLEPPIFPSVLVVLPCRKCYRWLYVIFHFQAKDKEIRGTKFVVAGLKEGGFYRFRVRAINAAGIGEPGEVTEVIEIKDRIGIS